MRKYTVALDQSTRNSGWALFADRELISCGVHSPSGDWLTRILELKNLMLKQIREITKSNNINVLLE